MEFLIVVLGLALDRVTKIWALKSLKEVSEIVVVKDFFSLYYLENKGAAFGMLQNKLLFLSIVTLAAVVGIVYYIMKYKPQSIILKISLALIISGALGNLFDRLYYKHVIDFFLVHYKDVYYFPVFNAADTFVVVGTILLALYMIRTPDKEERID